MTVAEMREKHDRLIAEARTILDTALAESRELTGDEDAKWSAMHDEADRLQKMADRYVQQENREKAQLEAEERQRLERERLRRADNPEERAKQYSRAFGNWMRYGIGRLGHEDRSILQRGYRPFDDAELELVGDETRALGTGTGGSPFGGYTVPEDFRREIETAMADFNGILRTRAGEAMFRTATGAQMPWPTVNDTAQKGELVAEGSSVTEQDVVFGRTVFDAWTYSSKMVKVQWQLLQDSAFNLEAYLRDIFAERLGRITAEHFITGDGSSKPRGVTIGAADSSVDLDISDADTSTVATGYAKLVDLVHAVDPAYRVRGEFLMNDATLKNIRKMRATTENIPIWNDGIPGGQPATILGHGYQTDPEMPDDQTATNRAMVFGDFSKYKIRMVRDFTMIRLDERYAESLQSAFFMYIRADGDVLDAGGNPLQYADMIA